MASAKRIAEIKQVDKFGRLNLGKDLAKEQYRVEKDKHGTITLTPVEIVPKRELWLHENKGALAAVKEGLAQSARGETKYIGSFAQYADDEVED